MWFRGLVVAEDENIFLCGMLFALMRVQGVGLPWLILSHAAFDSLVFIGATGESLVPDLITALFLFRALFVFAYYQGTKPWPRSKAQPPFLLFNNVRFLKDKPLSLISGADRLHILQKH